MSNTSKDDFNRLRAQFSRRANAREIPPRASKLCWWIAYGHMDLKRRITFVTQKTLATNLGGTVRSVQRMIDVLKPLGLKVAPGHGPDNASTYWISEADNTTSMSPIEDDNTTPMSPIQPGQGDISGTNRRHFRRQKATPVSRHIKNSKKNSKKVSNRELVEDDQLSSPDRAVRESAPSGAPADQRADALVGPAIEAQPPSAPSIKTADANASDPGTEALRRVQFLNVKVAYPPDRIGDEEVAFRTFCATKGERPVIEIVEDVKRVVMDENGDVSSLSDTLLTLARDQARSTR
ncbi:hypothetical protein WDM22_02085 [Bradyrhizobium septentrionale]|uniref:hypothetical protein n=1 Tax=Bradyrhizobium septentrionale TaxID=1404411 RepID=UPI0030CCE1F1